VFQSSALNSFLTPCKNLNAASLELGEMGLLNHHFGSDPYPVVEVNDFFIYQADAAG